MKKKMRMAVFAMLFLAGLAGAPRIAYAEPETETVEGAEAPAEDDTETADNSLSSLEIAQAVLNPEFHPEQLTYTAVVSNDVTRIALLANTSSPEARKVINGTSDLQVGENSVVITVTAADGSVREYRITVTREAAGTGEIVAPEETGEPGGETPGGEEPVAPGGNEPGENEPGGNAGNEPAGTEPGGADGPQNPDATGGQDFPSESGEDAALDSSGSVSAENNMETSNNSLLGGGKLSGRNLLLLILAIFCLVLVFVIIVLLLLRRRSDEEDDEEYDEYGEYDDADEYNDADEEDDNDEDFDKGFDEDWVKQEPDSSDDVGENDRPQPVNDREIKNTKNTKDAADTAGMVTPEELARFYQALNLDDMESLEDDANTETFENLAVEPEDDLEDDFEIMPEDDFEIMPEGDLEASHNCVSKDALETDFDDDSFEADLEDLDEIEILDLEEDDDLLEDDDDFDFLDF